MLIYQVVLEGISIDPEIAAVLPACAGRTMRLAPPRDAA